MATKTFCDLCEQEIPIGKKAVAISIHEGVAVSSQEMVQYGGRAGIHPAGIVTLKEDVPKRHAHVEVCLACAAERPMTIASLLEEHGVEMPSVQQLIGSRFG